MSNSTNKTYDRCSQCGAKMDFDSKSKKYKCKYCGYELSEKELKSSDENSGEKKLLLFVCYAVFLVIAFVIVFFVISVFSSMNNHKSSVQDKSIDVYDEYDDFFEDMKTQEYNFGLDSANGTHNGNYVCQTLDDVVRKNKKYPDHLITVVYGDFSSSNPDDIVNLKGNFEKWTDYEILIDYDSKGYVNKVTILNK